MVIKPRGIIKTMQELKEFDSVAVFNPTSEDFTHRYNGEPYTIPAKSEKAFSRDVAFHLAHHLSKKMIEAELRSSVTKRQFEDIKNPVHTQISQALVYDTPKRRIALYKILRHIDIVVLAVMAYPYKGFVGEMSEYEDFVKKAEEKKAEVIA